MQTILIQRGNRILPCVLAGLLFLALANPALATWSIVVANSETGEVAIGSATCLLNFDLKRGAGVIVVGKGAGQAQASGDSGQNRTTIANSLLQGMTARQVLEQLMITDPQLETHQYGIAVLKGGSATFTGSQTWDYTSGLAGQDGPLVYAIQGNVLTGEPVILAAEQALVHTEGDLGQKLMAAMHAAKYFGGDGRCSCNAGAPDGCGSPPVKKNAKKEKRWKSAHVAYMVIARMGDTDGVFNPSAGFANGSYYMDLNVVNNSPTDPVDVLQVIFDEFRASWSGHADHLLSEKAVHPRSIPADGTSCAELMIALVDIDRKLIDHGGASVQVTHDANSAGSTTIGSVIDHGDGTYSVRLQASLKKGTDIFRIVVDDRMGPVILYPFPTLEVK